MEHELQQMLDQQAIDSVQKPPGSLYTFFQDDVPAVLMNKTVELRLNVNRDRAQQVRTSQAQLRANRLLQQQQQLAVRKALVARAEASATPTPTPDPQSAKQQQWLLKTQQLLLEQRSREKQYTGELQSINSRVRERPSLAEQERVFAAKQAAERRYKQTLKQAGVDLSSIVTEQPADATADSESPPQ